jgi:hypothetical protein
MTSRSEPHALTARERRDYGFARVRDLAFDAVQSLWRRRRDAGMKQIEIVNAIGRQPAWVSRNLRAPGNWTLRTIGELVEALGGEVEIRVYAKEDRPEAAQNYSAYDGYGPSASRQDNWPGGPATQEFAA